MLKGPELIRMKYNHLLYPRLLPLSLEEAETTARTARRRKTMHKAETRQPPVQSSCYCTCFAPAFQRSSCILLWISLSSLSCLSSLYSVCSHSINIGQWNLSTYISPTSTHYAYVYRTVPYGRVHVVFGQWCSSLVWVSCVPRNTAVFSCSSQRWCTHNKIIMYYRYVRGNVLRYVLYSTVRYGVIKNSVTGYSFLCIVYSTVQYYVLYRQYTEKSFSKIKIRI